MKHQLSNQQMSKKNYITPSENESFDFLDSITKNETFLVPEDYFAHLIKEIDEKTNENTKLIPTKNRFRKIGFVLAAAAMLVLGIFVFNNKTTADDCMTFACLFENTELNDDELQMLEEESGIELFEEEEEEF